jgi:hypothetical protein
MSIIRTLALALAICAVGVSTAQAEFVDIHTPLSESGPRNYSMNSATGEYVAPTDTDGTWDRRNPDTADAAAGRGTASIPEITVVKVPAPAPAASSSGGMDWTDAGIGAGGMLAMVVVAGGGALAVVRRRGLRPAA